jgi:hypothetical protein
MVGRAGCVLGFVVVVGGEKRYILSLDEISRSYILLFLFLFSSLSFPFPFPCKNNLKRDGKDSNNPTLSNSPRARS